jgi:2-polyprenyl-3-methyl-5-hydroxy-6-metoxy-1,4-benzoquinol methylase
MKMEQACTPNHHAHYPGFAGLTGLLGAASMILGRQGDARLADELSGLRPEDTVVDVGCGPGAAARRAARKAASVTGGGSGSDHAAGSPPPQSSIEEGALR